MFLDKTTDLKTVPHYFIFSKLHQKYNRNLIADSEQELETHLRKRHLAARRYSLLAQQADASVEVTPRMSPTSTQPPPQATSEMITSIYTRQVLKTAPQMY